MAVASDESFVFWASPNIGKRVVVRGLFQSEHFGSDINGGLSTTRMDLNETNALTRRKRLVRMHFEMERVQWPLLDIGSRVEELRLPPADRMFEKPALTPHT